MKFLSWKIIFIVSAIIVILIIGIFFVLINFKIFFAKQTAIVSNNATLSVTTGTLSAPQKLSNPPEIIKAVYITGYSAGSKKYLDYLSNLFKNTEINAVVVDIKDYSGLISYNSDAPDIKKYKLYDYAISNIDDLVKFFHSQNIYVIGRIVVFEDPAYSKIRPELAIYNKIETTDLSHPVLWQDNHGLSWLDPASKDVWDYNISLAKDAFSHGFDEINFDYVRFPSDGKTENMGFPVWDQEMPKSEVIKKFFEYTRQQLTDDPPSPEASAGQSPPSPPPSHKASDGQGEASAGQSPLSPPPSHKASDGQGEASAGRGKISVDLFGQTTVKTDDMGIGQIIEDAFENFDYVSPMVYPSHYANGFIGFNNPAEHPYEVVRYSMDSALNREKIFFDKLTSTPGVNGDSTPGVNVTVNLSKLRPWLQDFDMGADYNADMIKAEIKAVQDALGGEFVGFMLWNPSNIYTEGAILKPR